MPRVPTYQPQIKTVTPTVSAPQVSRPPVEAFGGDVQAATARLGEQVQKSANLFGERVIQLQERKDDAQVLKTQAAFQTELDGLLHSTELDNGKPKGLLRRELANADGSTLEYDQIAPTLKAKYLETAVGSNSKMALDKILTAHLTTAREQISRNEGNQLDAEFKAVSDDNIKGHIQRAAALDDPIHVEEAIHLAHADSTLIYKHLGYSDKRIAFANQALAGQIVESAVAGTIEANPTRARAIFEANKTSIPADVQTRISKAIDGKMLYEEENAIWQSVNPQSHAEYRLPDGNADIAKMLAQVDSRTMSEEKKRQFRTAIEGRASVHDSNLRRERAGIGRQFTNDMIKFKTDGGALSDALLKAKDYSYDETEKAENQAAIRKLWTSNEASDPETAIALYKGIESGELQDQKYIRQQFIGGKISSADYVKFSNNLFDAQTKAPDVRMKNTWAGIEMQAKAQFGGGSEGKEQLTKFMHVLRTEADDQKLKTRDEIQGLADKELKRITLPFDRSWINPMRYLGGKEGTYEKTSYEVSYDQGIARDRSSAELKATLGADVYKAMGNDPARVVDIVGKLGGVEATKAGTPVNNAMRSLAALGYSVTPKKIADVIRQTGGTGIIPPNATVRVR